MAWMIPGNQPRRVSNKLKRTLQVQPSHKATASGGQKMARTKEQHWAASREPIGQKIRKVLENNRTTLTHLAFLDVKLN